MPSITLKRETLLRLLQSVVAMVERRAVLPVLGHLLLQVDGGRISVTASDMQSQIRSHADLPEVVEAWSATVPARTLLDLTRALSGDEIALSDQGGRLQLRCGSSRFSLQTLPPDQFPVLEPQAAIGAISLSQSALRQLLTRVYFAMAQQDIRPFMNGVCLQIEETKLSAVALDGHRLALATLITAHDSVHDAVPQSLLVPRKAVLELMRLLHDGERGDVAPVELSYAQGYLALRFGEIEFCTRLIDARYPDTRRAIPAQLPHVFRIARTAWAAALQRAAILSAEKFRSVQLRITAAQMTICASNSEHDEAEEVLDIDYTGQPFEIRFNVAYLLDALTHLTAPTVQMAVDPGQFSALLTIPGDDAYRYVAMALRG